MKVFRLVLGLLSSEERRALYFLFFAVLIMAGLQVISVASIMPFLSVASDPSSIESNVYLKWAFESFGFDNRHTFLSFLGVAALLLLVLSNAFFMLVMWWQAKYVWNCNHSISVRLLSRYLWQPYYYFITRNSSDLTKNILEETREITTKLLLPAIQGLARGIIALAIISFLMYIDPAIASIVAFVLGGAYLSIWLLVRNRLETIGRERVKANEKRYKTVNESLGGIKDIKLRGKEDQFLDMFIEPSENYAWYRALHLIINRLPRYALEAVAFGGVIFIAVYIIMVRGDAQEIIPMLGLYAFAGYRLMPALHGSFKGFARVKFNEGALETIHHDMYNTPEKEVVSGNIDTFNIQSDDLSSVELKNQLVFDDVSFSYPEAHEPAVKELSLEIEAQSTVGFVGKTGSGKTTVIDLMLGLFQPQDGTIWIDETPLGKNNLRSWRQSVGYVPQDIYLVDDTIARNIAFGVPKEKIDRERIEDVTRQAQIHTFIVDELPEGLDTKVGERGVKLSGGQRQRIGIARALYHRPSIVFFDEATSALDQNTEQEVMNAVYSLGQNRTVVLVSHRMSTVRRADKIVMLEQGQKVGEGTYEELSARHSKFRSMANS